MPVISEIVSQHAEEAAFRWLLRNQAVTEPHYSLSDLSRLDGVLDAHLDGLRIAGNHGWDIAKENLAFEESGEVFAASILALDELIKGETERFDAIIQCIDVDPLLSNGLVSAMGWYRFEDIEPIISTFALDERPFLKRCAIAAYAIHRKEPGAVLLKGLAHDDPFVRSRALKAVGELGRHDLLPALKKHIDDDDPDCRWLAAWATGLFKDRQSLPTLFSVAENGGEYAEEACAMAVRVMNSDETYPWLNMLMAVPGLARIAVKGAGVMGNPENIPQLIQMMEDPDLARPAGEAVSMITGVDLAYEDLEKDQPEGFTAGPTEDPKDENVDLDPDEDLPWPDPALVAQWWDENKNRFQTNTRYLAGRPVESKHLIHVLNTGYQRQRMAAAVELAQMHPDAPLFEVRAPGEGQKFLLGGGAKKRA
nr:TIGR02270 family protein [uncultured Desulfobacter sp.]